MKVLNNLWKFTDTDKDISDSLGGALYNAVLSVDINELDYLENVTIADANVTLNNTQNVADQYFGIITNPDGVVTVVNENKNNIDDQISDAIQKELKGTQNILQQIKEKNPNTRLSEQQLRDLYDDFSDDGLIIF